MKADAAVETLLLETAFFEKADELWEQLGRALPSSRENELEPFREIESHVAYRSLLATAEQVFARDVVLALLSRVRRWGKETLDATHVSTPQIHLFIDGCHRELAPDGVPVRWHYLLSLTRGEAPAIRLLTDATRQKRPFRFAFNQITHVRLAFNQLLVHDTREAYAIDAPKRAVSPLDGPVLLHGYLW